MTPWRTPADLLALALLLLLGALTCVVAAELVSLPPPQPFPHSIWATPVEMPLPATPDPTPLYAAIPQATRPLWMSEILMGPCRKPLPQARCTPVPMPRESPGR